MLPRSASSLPATIERPTQILENPLSDLDRGLRAVEVLQQHHELVAAEARRRVAGADALREPLGHVDQRLVAGAVAEAVVDRLEVVDIEEDHPKLAAARGARA